MNEINEAFDAMFKELQKTGDTYDYPDAARSVIEECKKVVQSRMNEYERESHEQCRIIGISTERELRMAAKMEELEKENASLKQDAARYRWLRDGSDLVASWYGGIALAGFAKTNKHKSELDTAIDAAMQVNKGN